LKRCVTKPMSPRLLTLLRVDAAPGEEGRSGFIEGDRLAPSTEGSDDSLKSWADSCGGGCLDDPERCGALLDVRPTEGGFSVFGVGAAEASFRRALYRCDPCDVCEAVDPCDARLASGSRESFARLHGWK
jgi:hypothetical protein